MADVKRVPCVTCNAPPPSAAHHPDDCQGLHFLTIAWCWECHQGPDGWHGTKARQRTAKQTWLDCLNETHRRVTLLRAGTPLALLFEPMPHVRQRGGDLSSDKVIKTRRY